MADEEFRVIYPDGTTDDMVSTGVPRKGERFGSSDDSYTVGYVDHLETDVPLVYLDPNTDEATPRWMIIFDVSGARYPLTLVEAAEFRRRARQYGASRLESPATVVAVRLSQMLEETIEESSPAMTFLDSELEAVRWIIEGWLTDVGATDFPKRVMALRYALFAEANPAPET